MAQTANVHQTMSLVPSRPIPVDVAVMFLRLQTVIRVTGLSRSTLYRLMSDDQFPRPVRLGPRAVAWRRTDIDAWAEARSTTKH